MIRKSFSVKHATFIYFNRRLKFLSQWDILYLKPNLIKLSIRGRKKKLTAMDSFGVIKVLLATVPSKSDVWPIFNKILSILNLNFSCIREMITFALRLSWDFSMSPLKDTLLPIYFPLSLFRLDPFFSLQNHQRTNFVKKY